jgi:adenylate cyclase
MTAGLREREGLQDLFGRHVGAEVAREALDRPVALGGEEREVAVLFVDLVGATSLATRWEPAEVVSLLNRFFSIVVDTVGGHGAGSTSSRATPPCACSGPPPRRRVRVLGARPTRAVSERLARELPAIDAAIGVFAGRAVAGNVGAEHRFEYTVIGDPVNEAARLCELAKQRPERVLASQAVLGRATEKESARWRVEGDVVLRGRSEPTGLAAPAGGSVRGAERGTTRDLKRLA